MPSPMKAASPCTKTARPRFLSRSPKRSCLARTLPKATGFTNSRWLGLKLRETCTGPQGVSTSVEWPRWYFTSPTYPSGKSSSNSRKMASKGFSTTWARTLSRPRWAMPSTTSRTPKRAASWTAS